MHTRRFAYTIAVAGTVLIGACGKDTHGDSRPLFTNLGNEGNADVVARFAGYKSRRAETGSGCRSSGNGTRVMVTGFGKFSGVPYNISSVVAQSLADPAFTPATLELEGDGSGQIGAGGQVGSGQIAESASGAETAVRSLTIRGRTYEICVLSLDVIWDLAPAIVAHEAEAFQPEMILMSGIDADAAVFEVGALNVALGGSGYAADGDPLPANAPVDTVVLPGAPEEAWMTWDAAALEAATRPLIGANGFSSRVASGPRWGSTYICNNTSFIVLEAARGTEMVLAGGWIRWTPAIVSDPKIGFFHYPRDAANGRTQVARWVQVLTTIIDRQLRD